MSCIQLCLDRESVVSIATAIVVRLLVSVPLAYLATTLLGLDALAQSVVMVVYAMPVAVFTIILSTTFSTNPRYVTNVVVASTFASAITLAVVIPVVKSLVME